MPDNTPEVLPEEAQKLELLKRPYAPVTEAQKETFFKAFLSDEPYREEFQLLDGNYRIVFKSLTMAENAALLKQVSYDRSHSRMEGASDYYFSRVTHYRLGLHLETINDLPFAENITSANHPDEVKEGTSFVAARADLFASWPMIKLAAVQASLIEFDQRLITLVDSVAKPDFWKAAA